MTSKALLGLLAMTRRLQDVRELNGAKTIQQVLVGQGALLCLILRTPKIYIYTACIIRRNTSCTVGYCRQRSLSFWRESLLLNFLPCRHQKLCRRDSDCCLSMITACVCISRLKAAGSDPNRNCHVRAPSAWYVPQNVSLERSTILTSIPIYIKHEKWWL